MITLDGWFDWAIRTPGPNSKLNRDTNGIPLFNPARGIFLHSAEGYKSTLLNLAVNGPLSWHLSNCMDGELHQHYPLTVQCWHASAANPRYIGMENEGVHTVERSINQAQFDNSVRVIKELSEWRGWTPVRPTGPTDITHTLWEHNEVTRIGGSATACPSGRIPWDVILTALDAPEPTPIPTRKFIAGDAQGGIEKVGNQLIIWNNGISVMAIGDYEGDAPGHIAKLFGESWRWLRIEPNNEPNTIWSTEKGD